MVGRSADFDEMVIDAKRQIMQDTLASELNVLANLFNRLAKQSRATRDFSLTGFREALATVVAHFPVYRTYVSAAGVTTEDRRDLDWALGSARRAARAPDTSIYDFIHAVLTLDVLAGSRDYRRRAVVDAAFKLQQYTGPVMAKAMEDTAFYRYVRLVSLNEVGGDPGRFGTRPSEFHEANRRRWHEHPFSMVTTATHDHKRGEDVRARLNVLSQVPREWTRRVRRWMQMNVRKVGEADGRPAPSRNDEYLFYQTVVGSWPYDLDGPRFEGIEAFSERLGAYMLKAAREAKLRTSWAAPNEAYERAVSEFVARTLVPELSRPFLEDVHGLVEQIAAAGAVDGLSQILLKLVSPGVPDTYQGTEVWDFSLVDPDNRRPIDYDVRLATLRSLGSASCGELLQSWRDGRIKQHVIHRALDVRRRHPALFAEGDYQPLGATGPEAERLLAFARSHDGRMLVAVVPRLVWPLVRHEARPLPRGWGATRLQLPETPGHGHMLVNVMSGAELEVPFDNHLEIEQLLAEFPVALLVSAAGSVSRDETTGS